MRGLIITVGMSNAGKSTYAADIVQNDPNNYTRVNRDDIRNLLFGYNDETVSNYYKRDDIHKLEKQVTRYEDTIIYDGLEHGKTVIVDATHLKRGYLERFKYWNVPTELVFFDVDLKLAFERNSKRGRFVDTSVMKKQFDQYKTLKAQLEKDPIDFTPITINRDFFREHVYCFDVDGTLAHHENRRSPYDWHKVGQDSVDISLANLTKHLKGKAKVIIATGRDGVCLPETEQWLENNEINYDEIYIRPKGDSRPDWLIKREMAEEISKDNYILGWFDDRLQVTRHLRMLGIPVYNVAHGNF